MTIPRAMRWIGRFTLAAALSLPAAAHAKTLYAAILDGDAPAVDSLLRAGAPANGLLWEGRETRGYPLPWAVQLGRYDLVRILLDHGADPNHPPAPSPLRLAIDKGDAKIARALLARGASRDVRDRAGFTPLHYAARAGREEIVHLLLGFGADPRAAADDGSTPLETAIAAGRRAAAERLLKAGAPLDARTRLAAIRAGLADWPPLQEALLREREARNRLVCERVVRSRSYAEVARFLEHAPDVPCRAALEALLDAFRPEPVVEPRLVLWEGAERVRPMAMPGRSSLAHPLDGEAALVEALARGGEPVRVRHLHGPIDLRADDFLLLDAGARVPDTDVRAGPALLALRASSLDGYFSVDPIDEEGLWTLNGLALVPVGTRVRIDGERPVHLFGLDVAAGEITVLPEGIRLETGAVLYRLPW
ncbi:MAG: ankyrin repeat domain-containing protein [Candidatus Eisenbacteria bacterium]|nr:ankyrin repeat domain-containing protein [Candidatus Eisenbacteria bacterium]